MVLGGQPVGRRGGGGQGERIRYKGPGSGMPGSGPVRGVVRARGGFGKGGLGGNIVKPGGGGGKVRKDRNQRYGKLVSEADQIENGKYIPWARAQAPGSVKEVTFNTEGRAAFLTGFRKRKTERQTFAKKTISDKETLEIKKGRRDKKRELMENYQTRVAEMKEIADQAKRLEMRKELGQESSEHDSDDDSDDQEEDDDAMPIDPPTKAVMAFGDARSGTATTVEVKEMDLSEFHDSSVLSYTPPFLSRPSQPPS